MNLSWICKTFNELTADEMYTILCVRQEVFVLEQECLYLDADGKDRKSHHLIGYNNGEVVAYARIVEPAVSYSEVSIGRILTTKDARRTGAGIDLMNQALAKIEELYGKVSVRISAQSYLKDFYQKFDFQPTGKEYLEDEIPHMEMLRA